MNATSRIFVAGHRGLVGSALVRALHNRGFGAVLTATREELDLRNPAAVDEWFRENRPEYVLLAAGVVGGILANMSLPAEFIEDNLLISASVVRAAHVHGVTKLLYLGSSCVYPREAPQPMREDYLLTGSLEGTSEPYAIAKIAGMGLCEAYRRQYGSHFISVVPTNLYGPHDHFDPNHGHVVPALIRRFHDAKIAGERSVTVWGSGTAEREFLHVDDLADACLFLMREYDKPGHVNIGTGEVVTIRELAEAIRDVVHPAAAIVFDPARPDGAPRKLLDVTRLHALGWRHRIGLREGMRSVYEWFLRNQAVSSPES